MLFIIKTATCFDYTAGLLQGEHIETSCPLVFFFSWEFVVPVTPVPALMGASVPKVVNPIVKVEELTHQCIANAKYGFCF